MNRPSGKVITPDGTGDALRAFGVGHASAMSALGGYLYSADYARTRLQGRRADQKNPASPQVPIIEHPDVRRMLLAQKAAVEDAQALCLYCATLVDRLAISDDEEEAKKLKALLALLTPVVKSWPSEHCLEILGGYGYTRDYPVERHYRDNRLNHIHEGAFGIQGVDLLGRKVIADGGATLQGFVEMMRETAAEAVSIPPISEDAGVLFASIDMLMKATRALMGSDSLALRLANATIYLDAFGHVVIGWIWLRQAIIAAKALRDGPVEGSEQTFYEGKLRACRYFSRHEMPLAQTRLALCGSLDDTSLETPVEISG